MTTQLVIASSQSYSYKPTLSRLPPLSVSRYYSYMSGHNKFSKIKHKKALTDAKKGKVYTKMAKIISVEVKKAGGDVNSPGVKAAIARAREYDVPNDNIERALKKGSDKNSAEMESIVYEAYGPGGVAIIIDVLTDNRNKAAAEIKHILSEIGSSLAAPGSASWAFDKTAEGFIPKMTTPISEEDAVTLNTVIEALEDNDEVQEIYTNAE
jgi:transcriptional/translational regulatory protein YebC/TACO1